MVSMPSFSHTALRRCPAMSSYPSSFSLAIAGLIIPFSFMLSMSLLKSSFSVILNGCDLNVLREVIGRISILSASAFLSVADVSGFGAGVALFCGVDVSSFGVDRISSTMFSVL
jgi:hypothetical protein